MKKSLILGIFLICSGCLTPKKFPEIDQALATRDQAIKNVQNNYEQIISTALAMYEAAEIRYLGSLVDIDMATAHKNVVASGKTPTFEEYKAFFAKLTAAKDAGVNKIKQRCNAVRQLLVLAQSDMLLHVKLNSLLDKYYSGEGENTAKMEEFIQKMFTMAEGYIKK